MQAEAEVEAAGEEVLGGQARHTLALTAPRVGEKEFTGQGTQEMAPSKGP